ncbi:hypothetical protein [Diaphorobacter sp.]|uniref:hypothetical protein n=1 Tax=Diaphorobacter sp. TaxID=1934310 RepID=UPI00258350E2|nr:hypothetical protein [Diaphorobacter sp.]
MTALRTQPNGHSRRTRHGAPWTSLPTLRPAQQALLCDWLRADAAERQWQSLVDIAGARRLEAQGIARFAPLLWLGGALTLNAPRGCIDVAAAGLCSLPTRLFGAPAQVRAPRRTG